MLLVLRLPGAFLSLALLHGLLRLLFLFLKIRLLLQHGLRLRQDGLLLSLPLFLVSHRHVLGVVLLGVIVHLRPVVFSLLAVVSPGLLIRFLVVSLLLIGLLVVRFKLRALLRFLPRVLLMLTLLLLSHRLRLPLPLGLFLCLLTVVSRRPVYDLDHHHGVFHRQHQLHKQRGLLGLPPGAGFMHTLLHGPNA
ncbi:hypothetical protein Q0Q72_25075 [Escherichia coli O13:H15]